MSPDEKEKLLQQFLDGELSPDEEEEALHIIAEDSDLRNLLQFDIQLRESFKQRQDEVHSFEVPEGFSSQVMQKVHAREKEKAAEKSFTERLNSTLDTLIKPVSVRLRPAYGLALAILLVVTSWFVFNIQYESAEQPVASLEQAKSVQVVSKQVEQPQRVWARFIYINNTADSVAVAGDFSNWEPVPLKKQKVDGQKVWTGLVELRKGEHRYMYVINGSKWVTDPLASRYKNDGFGNKNAVISF